MSQTVLMALSGGVDSAFAAALLKKDKYELIGVSMRVCKEEIPGIVGSKRHGGCYGTDKRRDIEDARGVAEFLKIPFYEFDLCQEFESRVLSEFIAGYEHGLTPNPCIYCNPRIKFGALVQAAESKGLQFNSFATGHYAQVEYDISCGRYLLKKGKDSQKDQSYFLGLLNQEQLKRALFPLGGYNKQQVRNLAREMGIPIADKPESQDFVSGGYQRLLSNAGAPGPIVDKYARQIGTHNGIARYTIGQHKGLNIATSQKLFVVRILAESNTIVVGEEKDLFQEKLFVRDLNWVAIAGLSHPLAVEVRIRSHTESAEAIIEPWGEMVKVVFEKAQKGVAPGQAAVFYRRDVILGAGIICADLS
ncbi:MAG: tRNA 2-thiouridine(34) synthase MnmA [Dehalococcoidia bacterium]|nr:tRNA 2-thiouridine(34) synthase MnmA [Dehalococcoidia bacterium]